MTDRELMQQALKALEVLAKYENPLTKIQVRKPRDGGPIVTMYPHQVATNAAELLRGRLAQPEQEPVAWMCSDFDLMHRGYSRFSPTRQGDWNIPVYTTPPRREWVGLTDEEIRKLCDENFIAFGAYAVDFISTIEAKLKEKNT